MDYKWNKGWLKELFDFMKLDPIYRKDRYNQLVFSMIYNYSEKFILALPEDAFSDYGYSMLNMMPGSDEEKFASVKAALGYTFLHPGKKLISDSVCNMDDNNKLNNYVKELNNLMRQLLYSAVSHLKADILLRRSILHLL